MSNGVLGKSLSQAAANVIAYTAPVGLDFATVSINLCNLGAGDSAVRVAIGTSPNPSPQDFVEYGATIPGNGGILERTCMVVSAGENVIVFADSSEIAIRVSGLEKLL
jgi:hypothetical protein